MFIFYFQLTACINVGVCVCGFLRVWHTILFANFMNFISFSQQVICSICLPIPSEFICSFCHSTCVRKRLKLENFIIYVSSSFPFYCRPFRLASIAYKYISFFFFFIYFLPWTVLAPNGAPTHHCCCKCTCFQATFRSKRTNKQPNINVSVHFQFFAFPFYTGFDRRKLCSWNVRELLVWKRQNWRRRKKDSAT